MPDDLTLAEAASLLSGADLSRSRSVREDLVPAVVMTDGPHGLAMNLPDFSGKVEASCFPSPGALAATWDVALVRRVAHAIGVEARAAGAGLLLGPSVNIRRSPLGGRGFEYYSEDPLVSGRIGAAFVEGVQSAGVGACVKHFAVNSQETDRMRVSSEVSERALREIYLAAFEDIVTRARPAAVMASYNRVNGTGACENRRLLTTILREEWGFDGAVISDWGAVDDRIAAVRAGLDLEMPGGGGAAADDVLRAVDEGRLTETEVRTAAARWTRVARAWPRAGSSLPAAGEDRDGPDHAAHLELAVRAAESATVLLKNDGTLPLRAETGRALLVVGELAQRPRLQGGGSSSVQSVTTVTPLEGLRSVGDVPVAFEPGYALGDGSDPELADRAVAAAAAAGDVVVIVGPADGADSEGRDRDGLALPADQSELVSRLVAVNPRTVVVLNHGGGFESGPWCTAPAATLVSWLPGSGGGEALANVVYGRAEPGGRLTETVPWALADTPTALSFPGISGRALHGEGVFVGYRGYDRRDQDVAFPFGHGLGYTSFRYGDVTAEPGSAATDAATVRFTVSNVGDRAGSEVWQLYMEPPSGAAPRPSRELVAFGKVTLAPGERVTVTATVEWRAFARWDERWDGWAVDAGDHRLVVGSSSRDIRGGAAVRRAEILPPRRLDESATLVEWMADVEAGPLLREEIEAADPSGATTGFVTNETVLAMIGAMPIRRLFDDSGNVLSAALIGKVRRRLEPCGGADGSGDRTGEAE